VCVWARACVCVRVRVRARVCVGEADLYNITAVVLSMASDCDQHWLKLEKAKLYFCTFHEFICIIYSRCFVFVWGIFHALLYDEETDSGIQHSGICL
jgi:hypothetical protein